MSIPIKSFSEAKFPKYSESNLKIMSRISLEINDGKYLPQLVFYICIICIVFFKSLKK